MINTDPNHKHTYNEQGEMNCCSLEEKVNKHSEDHEGHDHSGGDESILRMFLPSIISLGLLLTAIAFDTYFTPSWFTGWVRVSWYAVAYVPVGIPVIKDALLAIRKGEVFSEFFFCEL